MLCPGFLYLLQPWSLPGKSLGTKMASMLESTALWRKEDLRLGYVWIGVGIFARPCIGPCEKKNLNRVATLRSTKHLLVLCRTWSRNKLLDGFQSSEALLSCIQSRDQFLQEAYLVYILLACHTYLTQVSCQCDT